MKLITAVIKPFKLDEVRESLLSVGILLSDMNQEEEEEEEDEGGE